MSREQGSLYLGTSGWAHRDWVGVLYAHDLTPPDYLPTYARQFNTVEIEHTFFEIGIVKEIPRKPDEYPPCQQNDPTARTLA